MPKWKIVTDSGSDLRVIPSENIAFQSIPLYITIDGETFEDSKDLDINAFQKALKQTKSASSSSCPSPEQYSQAMKGYENVICFTLTSQLSGSYNSACLGRDMVLEDHPNANIYVCDSRTAGAEINLLIYKTMELIESGLDFDQVVQALTDYHQKTYVAFLLQSVQNLVNNGRVNRLIGQMVGLLNILLIGRRSPEGTIALADKTRGKKKAFTAVLKEMMGQGYQGGRYQISHANNLEDAQALDRFIQEKYPGAESSIIKMSALCNYYAEEKGLIVGYEFN